MKPPTTQDPPASVASLGAYGAASSFGSLATTPEPEERLAHVQELAARAAEFVERALGVYPDLDDPVPDAALALMDHYIRALASAERRPELLALVTATLGSWFGELARRTLGGRWEELSAPEPAQWRLVLFDGVLTLHPIALADEVIRQRDRLDGDGGLLTPRTLGPARGLVHEVLVTQGDVDIDYYFSLVGRWETLELVRSALERTRLAAATPNVDAEGDNDDSVTSAP
jgi:hypothetical protein